MSVAMLLKQKTGKKPVLVTVQPISHPYLEEFYAALRDCNVEIRELSWSGRQLLGAVKEIDFLHLHWPSFLYSTTGGDLKKNLRSFLRFAVILCLLRLRGVRLIWTAHNLYPHDGGKALWQHRWGRFLVVNLVSVVAAHSGAAAKMLVKEFPRLRKKIILIDHGHWVGRYENSISRDEARKILHLSNSAYVFLFLGICKPYKNLDGLVCAFSSLKAKATLVIAGKFHDSAYCQLIGELAAKSDKDIRIHDRFVPDAALQIYFNAADTVVLPYSEILTSGAAILSMGFGRPVVAPQKGCLRDLINKECGIAYDEEGGALARAMSEIMARNFNPAKIREQVLALSWQRAAHALASRLRD